ncbi:MAG: TonB family protein [Arcobacteraceae bacterium]|nr:TonB family protein [Arcobacteraceae bacterium]
MITSRYFNSFFITFFLFSTLFFGIFLIFKNQETFAKNISNTPQKISFTIISQKPQPVVEQKVVEKPIEKVVEKPIAQPKPIAQKPKQIEPVATKQTQAEPTPTAKEEVKQVVPAIEQQIAVATQIDTNAIKEEFLKTIKININKNKVYPKRAVSRGIEGMVDVNFKLLSNGTISDINISGHNVFTSSIEDALAKSFPVSIPKELNMFPMVINFQIAFNLK